MTLDRIRLSDFRNHRDSALAGTRHFNLLTGENGAGKTNVLEAISLLAPGRGLRRAPLAEMAAQAGAGGFAISADLVTTPGSEPARLGTGIAPARPGRRIVRINGAGASGVALAEWLGVFWLTPAMDRLFTDGASARRRFLDRLVLALHPAHAGHAARSEGALRERNRLLTQPAEPDPTWLDAIEAQMAEAGAALNAGRAMMAARLDASVRAAPPSAFARPELALAAGGPAGQDALADALAGGRARDRAAGRSLIGPHRDDLIVTMAAKNQPAAACSTGEQKAMLIAITLTHSELADAEGEERPRLLLLDEVAAHLDPLRRAALFERLAEARAQVWMTGTEPGPFEAVPGDMAHWTVAGGRVTAA